MVQFLGRLFDADFLPHGHCFLWQPAVLWLHAVSDGLIAASYFAIPVIIIYLTRRRRDLPFPAVFLLFAAFIFSCGTTHVMGIVTLWEPVYRLDGAIKALTATFSVLTALALVPLVPRALALPSSAQWETANRRLREEIAERQEMEAALRRARNELEARVLERTAELAQANDALRREVADRTRAEEQLRQHALRLENLHEVDRAVLAAASAEDIVGAALARIRLLVPSDRAEVVLFELEQGTARVIARDVEVPDAALDISTVPLEQFSPLEALREAPSACVADLAALGTPPPIMAELAARGMRSAMLEALIAQGQLVGLLKLACTSFDAFAVEHRSVAREVADQLAVALHDAQLKEQLQRYTEELEHRVEQRTAQLEATNRELETFSYSVSHDLRAPLRAIAGFNQMLLEDHAERLDADGRECLDRIRTATQRMGQLIDDLLGLARVARGVLHWQEVNLSTCAESIAAELRKAQSERQVEIVIAPRVVARGDERLLRVALENLLSNAWKYTGKQATARIEFGASVHEGQPVYFVRDDGAGFDPQYADKLFAPFQRLHDSAEFEGTGIGLATVQRIIHRHGGRLWAESAVAAGATFYFTLAAEPPIA